MRLDSIATKNYRTLQDLTLVFSKHYCTISGRNNAGKSGVIRLLSGLFGIGSDLPWLATETDLDYTEDKTQWLKQPLPIEVTYTLSLTREEDPALFSFTEVIASKKIDSQSTVLRITYTTAGSNDGSVSVTIDGEKVDEKAGKEIDKRIKDSNLLFLYNSTAHHQENIYLGRGRRKMFYEFVMSDAEKKILDEAGKYLEKRARSLAKQHTQNLSEVLGRLTEKYEVAVSTPEGFGMRRMPLGVNLRDRNVEVPLNDWGSGTQNRTRILMAILQANRIKTMASPDEKVTPFVVIEEPESFLHPSAQAEFGRMLYLLSSEFGIQVIVTTHSPYMLNQEEPSANILLAREIKRKKPFATILVETSGDNWMAPFSDHLGIGKEQFTSLRPLFSVGKSRALLVEGQLDLEYFEFLKQHNFPCAMLAKEVEIAPYGGKDTLKNTLLVQFVLRKFDLVFVTYDLDAHKEVQPALNRLDLKENVNYAPLGINQARKNCIEGLLPDSVLSAVNGRETDLVMKLGGSDSSERRKAKEMLKKEYLKEFKSRDNYTRDDLKELSKVVRQVNARLKGEAPV